jgi:hypothetical protein
MLHALLKTNNRVCAYALPFLNSRHEYGRPEHTIQLLQICDKGKMMNCWESYADTTATWLINRGAKGLLTQPPMRSR